ncbi:MAG: carbohydrate-binding family 9-like protein [Verrucomicrobiota bacterium]
MINVESIGGRENLEVNIRANSKAAGPLASPMRGHKFRARQLKPLRLAGNSVTRVILLLAFLHCATTERLLAGSMEDWAKMNAMVPKGYVCYPTPEPLKIDGRLDEAAWQSVPWTENFADIEGETKTKPRQRTRAKMLWDKDYFYVAAELEERHVWATITEHDAVIFNDNDFEVFIDPNGDSHDYYEFEINALNTSWDLLLKKPYKDGGPALNSWEIPGLKTAVHVNGTLNNPSGTDANWTVELAFPWKALAEFASRKTPPSEGEQWRVNFSRVEWQIEIVDGKYRKVAGKKEDNWIWSPQGIVDMHRPEKWGYVQFTQKKAGTVSFLPDPATEAKNQLHRIYYAQKDFHEKENRWAKSLEELSLLPLSSVKEAPIMRPSSNGFEATIQIKMADGKIQRWHIRQDARIWSD